MNQIKCDNNTVDFNINTNLICYNTLNLLAPSNAPPSSTMTLPSELLFGDRDVGADFTINKIAERMKSWLNMFHSNTLIKFNKKKYKNWTFIDLLNCINKLPLNTWKLSKQEYNREDLTVNLLWLFSCGYCFC